MTDLNPEADVYMQMGIAALIPGMQRMIELMQQELDRMRAKLAAAQSGEPTPVTVELKTLGRPKGRKSKSNKGGWPADPLDRAKEQARRKGVAEAKREAAEQEDSPKKRKARKPGNTHPRDANHKGHKAWLAKLRKSQKLAWKVRKSANGHAAAVIQ